MFINLTDVLTSEEEMLTMQVETEMREVSIGGEVFRILEKSPVRFTFSNIGKGRAMIDGCVEFTFAVNCDRCLKPLEKKLMLEISREVHVPDAVRESYEDADTEDDDQSFMEGYQLNVEDLLNNEIMINWPRKVLCKPDCKGICIQCGKDLNTGDCECDTFVPDPRMAVIKDIFNANKEV
ncbi:MAG: DUF177 domain-containing protein [Roseburia sp.]|nr:DUF177 domain-containing protein [Ruminococcus sp.]MCM1155853.1 DUF177 domain-containing protein [Roseburia sp.]MCM1242499.1 DUF177 domain-containing protein [Roseburia sp.]